MKIPLNGSPSDCPRFGIDHSRRKWTVLAIVSAALAVGFGLVFSGRSAPLPAALAGAAILVVGLLLASRMDNVVVDPRCRVIRTTKGVWPLLRRRIWKLADFDRLFLEVTSSVDAYGEERVMSSLYLVGESRRISLLEGWDGPDAENIAARIASALGWPTPGVTVVARKRGLVVQRGITFGAWIGMASLAGVMIWPAISTSSRRTPRALRQELSSNSGRLNSPISRFDQGRYLYDSGQFSGAENVFRETLDRDPGNAWVLNMLAYSVADQGRTEEALKIANRALAASRGDWMIIDTVAEMHQRRGDYKSAATYYREALKSPNAQLYGETHCKYGETLLEIGQRALAIEHLRLAAAGSEPKWADRARRALARLKR